ncbi:MAG: hypothetical protein WKI04_06870 [Ferruginibacter sp.]
MKKNRIFFSSGALKDAEATFAYAIMNYLYSAPLKGKMALLQTQIKKK